VHGTVSPSTNRFLSVIGIRTLGFGRRLFLAIAGLIVFYVLNMMTCDTAIMRE